MPTSQEIRRRIKSIRSTRQITRAMQLVSAVKMRTTQRAALSSRTYARWSWSLLQQLTKVTPEHWHPLLAVRDTVHKEAVVVIAANRGLAGSFNAAVIEHAADYVRSRKAAGVPCDIILLGKRGRALATRFGFSIVAEYERLDAYTDMAQTLTLTHQAVSDFLQERYDQVTLIYTEFFNTLKQEPITVTLLPTKVSALKSALERTVGTLGDGGEPDHIFEPSPQAVLDTLLPRCLEMQVYQAALESTASEHSARMVAMKNATDAANDLISDLTLSYNQLRQASITKELTEISAGRLAVQS